MTSLVRGHQQEVGIAAEQVVRNGGAGVKRIVQAVDAQDGHCDLVHVTDGVVPLPVFLHTAARGRRRQRLRRFS